METLVNMIQIAKNNIAELEEACKKNIKARKALEEEYDNITRNLAMFKKVLEGLTGIKENEIQVVMAEKPKKVKKTAKGHSTKKVAVKAVDEKNEVIATYRSTSEAGADLKINPATVRYRMALDRNVQIEKFGYSLERM